MNAPPALEFFDCDVLIGPTLRAEDPGFSASEMAALLQRCGVDRALVYTCGIGPEAWLAQNIRTGEACAAMPRFHPVRVLPQSLRSTDDDLSALVAEWIGQGTRAFRLDPETGPTAGPLVLDEFPFAPAIWGQLSDAGLPVLVPGAHLPESSRRFGFAVRELSSWCARYPRLPIILLNPPYSLGHALENLLSRHPNLTLSITRLAILGQLEYLVSRFGPERFVFGSAAPWNHPAIARGNVAYANLPLASKCLIASGNLRRLLGLPTHD